MKKFLKILLGVIFAVCFVLAVACGNTDDGTIDEDELLYQPSQTVTTANTYNGITIDGTLDDSEWSSIKPYECHNDLGGFASDYKMWATTCDEGVLLAFNWRGPQAYRNPSNVATDGSCVELYIASGNATQIKDNAWQIELLPNGAYQTTKSTTANGYTQYNAAIEYAAKVHGQINVDNDGFDGEAMIPWSMLGEKTDTVSIDAALIVQEAFDKSRLGWYSITSLNEDGYSWNNPQGWLRYTDYGWFDKNDPVAYKLNGGEVLENATANMQGSYNEGSVFTVIPDEGYVLKSLTINGKEYNSLSVSIPTGTIYANIDVEIEKTELSKVIVPVTAGYAYSKKTELKNTAVTLLDGENNFYAGITDNEGRLSLYAPDGTYTLQIQGYKNQQVTIDGGAFTGLTGDKLVLTKSSVTIDYVADSVKDYVTIEQTENGDKFLFTGTSLTSKDNRFILGADVDYTAAALTFTVGDTQTGWVDLRVDTIKNKNSIFKSRGHSSNAGAYSQVGFRTADGQSTYQLGAGDTVVATKKTSASYMMTFMTENKVTTVKFFVLTDGAYEYIGYFTCDQVTDLFLSGTGGGWNKPVSITDIKFYTEEEMQTVIATAEDSSDLAEVVAPEKAYVGDLVKVTITPKQATTEGKEVAITGVYVNGKAAKYDLSYDGTVEFSIRLEQLGENYSIKVVTEEVSQTKEIVFSVVHKYDKEKDYYPLENAKLAFVSDEITKYALCTEGSSYKVKLADGTYTLQVEGHDAYTLTVENGAIETAELKLTRAYVWVKTADGAKDLISVTKGEDGSYSVKTTGALTIDNLIAIGTGIDYTDTIVTLDVDWLRKLWSGGGNHWIDFRMNTTDKYKNEKNQSSALYSPEGTNRFNGSGVGSYYMFSMQTNSYTCMYSVGAEGEQRYFEWASLTRPNSATTSASYAFKFKTADGKTTVSLYIKLADGTYAKLGEMTGAAVKDFFLLGDGGGWDKPIEFNNIKFYENASIASDVVIGESTSEYVDVTVDKEKVGLSDTLTITVTPKTIEDKTVTITAVKVNGNGLTLKAGDNGVVTATYTSNLLQGKLEVVVEAVAKGVVRDLTFQAAHKYVGETESSALNGEKITFVMGAEETVAEYEDGKYKVSLADGVYTAKLRGHNDLKVEIVKGVMHASPLTFEREKVFVELTSDGKDKVSLTKAADGSYSVKTSGALTVDNLIVLGNGIDYTDTLVTLDVDWMRVWGVGTNTQHWVDFRMNTDDDYNNEKNSSASIYGPTGSAVTGSGSGVGSYYLFSIMTNAYTCQYTVGAAGEQRYFEWSSLIQGASWQKTNVYSSYAFKFRTADNKTTVTLYIKLADGTYAKIGEMTGGKVKDFFLLGEGGKWDFSVEINNIKFYENASKTITVSESSSKDVDVSFSQNKVGLGESATITVTPKDTGVASTYYAITAIKVNGKDATVSYDENGVATTVINQSTVVADNYEITVETRLKKVEREVTFAATHKYDSEENYYAMTGEEITFAIGSEVVTAQYLSDGNYKVLISDGTYTVKAYGHSDLTVEIENGVMSPSDLAFTRERAVLTTVDDDKEKITLTKADDGSYSVKAKGSLNANNLVVLGNGLDYTDALVTFDVNWTCVWGKGNYSQWLDFRMNSDDNYDNEKNSSASIYGPAGSAVTGSGSGAGSYYMFGIFTNTYTLQYKVGADGEQRYFEWDSLMNGSWQQTVVHSSYAFTFKTVDGKTTVAFYIKYVDGSYAKLGEMTGAAVKDFFLLGAGGGWNYPVEFNNIKFYENASKSITVSESSSEDVDVSLSQNKVGLGETVTITATLKDSAAKKVSAIKVNGTAVAFTAGEDGVVTATFTASTLQDKYEVEVLTEDLSE